MRVFDLAYDKNIAIGYGVFTLPESHPFYRAAIQHDSRYDQKIAGTCTMTLKQIDREFLRNCLRAAATQNWLRGTEGAIDYVFQAYACYAIVRGWAVAVRSGLDKK